MESGLSLFIVQSNDSIGTQTNIAVGYKQTYVNIWFQTGQVKQNYYIILLQNIDTFNTSIHTPDPHDCMLHQI